MLKQWYNGEDDDEVFYEIKPDKRGSKSKKKSFQYSDSDTDQDSDADTERCTRYRVRTNLMGTVD
jgi:hypothetical protein